MTDEPSKQSPVTKRDTKLYAFGSNGKGQLGIGHDRDTAVPQLCSFSTLKRKFNKNSTYDGSDIAPDQQRQQQQERSKTYLEDNTIIKLVAGGNHTLLLTGRGRIWAAGNSQGDGNQFREWDIDGRQRVTDIAATWEASFIVIGDHEVYVYGTGVKGELGLGRDVDRTSTTDESGKLVKVMDLWDLEGSQGNSIVDLAAGMNHVVVVSSSGRVYGWGSCRKGQLGDDLKDEHILWELKRLSVPFEVTKAVAGRDFTFLVGHDQDQILLGDRRYLSQSIVVNGINPRTHLSCGWSNIYALSDGCLQVFGRNDRGQLSPEGLPSIKAVVPGSEHCLAIAAGGKVLAWGWGEHGNCGLPVDNRGNVAGRWNEISTKLDFGDTIGGIAAGCATSFIFVVHDSN